MKKIYEIPEVNTFKIDVHQLIAESIGFGLGTKNASDACTNSNSMDDQSTPWYSR